MNIKNSIVSLCIAITISSIPFFAQSKNFDKSMTLKTYKCHVSLISGEETVHFLTTNKTKSNNISRLLSGSKVASYTSGKLFDIYKVIECVAADTKFTAKKSRQLEAKIPR